MKKIRYLAKNGREVDIPEDQALDFEKSGLLVKKISKETPQNMKHVIIRGRGGPRQGEREYSGEKEL